MPPPSNTSATPCTVLTGFSRSSQASSEAMPASFLPTVRRFGLYGHPLARRGVEARSLQHRFFRLDNTPEKNTRTRQFARSGKRSAVLGPQLPERHGAGGCYIEGVHPMVHGDLDGHIASHDSGRRQPVALRSQNKGQPVA